MCNKKISHLASEALWNRTSLTGMSRNYCYVFVQSVIFLSSGFLVSHPVLVKSTAYSNHYCFFGKDIVLVVLKKGALTVCCSTLDTGLKATASSKAVGLDEDGSSL